MEGRKTDELCYENFDLLLIYKNQKSAKSNPELHRSLQNVLAALQQKNKHTVHACDMMTMTNIQFLSANRIPYLVFTPFSIFRNFVNSFLSSNKAHFFSCLI